MWLPVRAIAVLSFLITPAVNCYHGQQEVRMERMPMESSLATPADAEIILKLYDLRREELMRKARAWVIGVGKPS